VPKSHTITDQQFFFAVLGELSKNVVKQVKKNYLQICSAKNKAVKIFDPRTQEMRWLRLH